MKKGNDTIQFESRYEIDEVLSTLQTFLEEHPKARESETIERLRDL